MSFSRKAGQISAPAIRAVSFDVGGTLIAPWPSVGHIYAEVAARHGWPEVSVETLNRNFARAWKALDQFTYTKPEWAALVKATFSGAIERPPAKRLFSELYERFAQPTAWKTYDDVFPVLDRLKGYGLKLAVISNWDRRLPPLLRRLALHDYFDAIVVSCYARYAKPAPEIFRLAARKLSLSTQSILHVGDSREMDFLGARNAGLKALLLERKGATASETVTSLADVEAFLGLR